MTALRSSDQSLLLAIRAWAGDVGPHFWGRFAPEWSARLRSAPDDRGEDEPALARLQGLLARQIRPDPGRVHPSWLVRGLKEESSAVQRAVLGSLTANRRETLCAALGLAADDLRTDLPPHPEALNLALTLWTERLVGDVAERPDDPPAIVALTRRDRIALARLVRAAGLAKWALSPSDPPRLRPVGRARFDRLRARSHSADARMRQRAGHDVAALGTAPRHALMQLGALTLARLLTTAEPYRTRWALQHVPYAAAKYLRARMAAANSADRLATEAEIWRAAEDQLREEAGA